MASRFVIGTMAFVGLASLATRSASAQAPAMFPDLTVSNVAAPAGSAPGDTITFTFTVGNTAGNVGVNSANYSIGYYLSTDANITTGDQLLCASGGATLAAGASGNFQSFCVLSGAIAQGNYFVGIIADRLDQLVEFSESNNAGASAAPVTICTDSGREPNGTLASATALPALSVTFGLFICGPKDKDNYQVTATVGQTISAAMAPPATHDYDLELLDAAGAVVAASTNAAGVNDSVFYTVPVAGLYYVRITGFNAVHSPTSPYSMRVEVADPLSLTVTPAPPAANLGINRAFEALTAGHAGRMDSLSVQINGSGSSGITWTATHSAGSPWVTLNSAAGTGSGVVRYTPSASSLAPGTYVDTITVTANSLAPVQVVDTLVVVNGVNGLTSDVPVVVAGAQGSAAFYLVDVPANAGSVTIATNGGTGDVDIFCRAFQLPGLKLWDFAPYATGNNESCTWNNPAAGQYVVLLQGFADYSGVSLTATVLSAATLALSKPAEWHAVPVTINGVGTDSVGVILSGPGAPATSWTATHRAAATWIALDNAAGTGTGMVRFTRNSTGLTAGTYIDTIRVAAPVAGSPLVFVDTLVVAAAPTVLANGDTFINLSGAAGSARYFEVTAPIGTTQFTASTFGGSGGLFLYIHFQQQVSSFTWFAASEAAATTAQSTGFTTPSGFVAAAPVYVIVRGTAAYSGVAVTATASSPLTLALFGAVRHDTVIAGAAAVRADSQFVTLGGTGAAGTAWTANHRAAATWNTLTTAGGTGSGLLRWNRNPGGLAAGVYVDTITVTAAGAAGSPALLVDSLVVINNPITLSLGSGLYRAASASITATITDSAAVGLSGPGAGSVPWSVTHRAAATWNSSMTAGGNGSGWVTWNRSSSGLGVGVYIDTITVTAAAGGSPAILVDTMVIAPAPVVLTSGVAVNGLAGGVGSGQFFELTAPAQTTQFVASTTGGTGDIQLATAFLAGITSFRRNCFSNAAGSNVETCGFTSGGFASDTPVYVFIRGIAAYSGVSLTATATGSVIVQLGTTHRTDTALTGSTTLRLDSSAVGLGGTSAASTAWTATHRAAATWINLTTAGGTGSGTLRFTRDPSGLAAGVYLDTIVVTAAGSPFPPARFFDTLVVMTPATLTLQVTPSSRGRVVTAGATATAADSADVLVGGPGAASATWTATHSAAATWITLTNAGGTGSGMMRYAVNPSGLAAGVYIDSITVTVAGATGSPARVVDSLIVSAALSLSVTPGTRRDTIVTGATGTRLDSATVALTGVGAGAATWTASHRAAATWVTLTTAGGTGSGQVRWTRAYTGLAPGVYIDTITVTAAGVAAPGRVIDTLVVNSALTLAGTPGSRRDSTFTGLTGTRADSATVTLTGANAGTTAWTATHRAAATWITLTTAGGNGSGRVRWTRTYNGLAAGTFIDTITITVAGAGGSPARVIDTLVVIAKPVSTVTEVADGILSGGGGSLTAVQRLYLDQIGNRNGQFDLGDFLAYVLANPAGADAGTVAAVMSTMTPPKPPAPRSNGRVRP